MFDWLVAYPGTWWLVSFETGVCDLTESLADTYLNDVRFDLTPSITASGQGVAYITDSSMEGRTGLIIVDLGTGEAWRHLNLVREVQADPGFMRESRLSF